MCGLGTEGGNIRYSKSLSLTPNFLKYSNHSSFSSVLSKMPPGKTHWSLMAAVRSERLIVKTLNFQTLIKLPWFDCAIIQITLFKPDSSNRYDYHPSSPIRLEMRKVDMYPFSVNRSRVLTYFF